MFAPMKIQIFDDKQMVKYIERRMPRTNDVDAPRKAVARVRSVIGAFRYLQETEIVNILKREKKRIGVVIEALDKELPKTPRKDGATTYKPWGTLGLGAKWDTYMEGVYKTAKDKGTKFVDDNIKRLKDEYTSQKAKDAAKGWDDTKKSKKERNEIKEWSKLREDIEKMIERLEREWVLAKGWAKPW
jgi:hypothetical protein